MKQKKPSRFVHGEKSGNEREKYRDFLASRFRLDKTVDDPIDVSRTNESFFEEEEQLPLQKARKTSPFLKVKDFLADNWVSGFILAVLTLCAGWIGTIYREQGVQEQKIDTIKENVGSLKTMSEEDRDDINSIKNSHDIFKVEISKDLEYIKKKLEL